MHARLVRGGGEGVAEAMGGREPADFPAVLADALLLELGDVRDAALRVACREHPAVIVGVRQWVLGQAPPEDAEDALRERCGEGPVDAALGLRPVNRAGLEVDLLPTDRLSVGRPEPVNRMKNWRSRRIGFAIASTASRHAGSSPHGIGSRRRRSLLTVTAMVGLPGKSSSLRAAVL